MGGKVKTSSPEMEWESTGRVQVGFLTTIAVMRCIRCDLDDVYEVFVVVSVVHLYYVLNVKCWSMRTYQGDFFDG